MAHKKRKVDVLMLSRAYPPAIGGVATHVNYLAEALTTLTKSRVNRASICRVEVVTATEPGLRAIGEAAHPVATPRGSRPFLVVHRLPGANSHFYSTGDVPLQLPLRFIQDNWRKIRPDVIHVHDYESLQIGLMLKVAFSKPLVLTVHRTPKETDRTLPQRDAKSCFLEFVRRYDLVDVVVAPSDAYLQHLISEGFQSDRVERIRHGIPVQRLAKQGQDNPRVLERLNLDPGDELVLCPARLDPHKGPDTFIEAAALTRERLKTRRLVFAIAGSGSESYRRDLYELARRRQVDDIVRLGASDGKDFLPTEMPTLYRRAKVCVLPSRREGLGQALLEAAVFGCPVIGANTGGIPEVIKPMSTGLLFHRDEPRDLAEQLTRLLEDQNLAGVLADGAARQLRLRFDAEGMAREYLALYLRVAGLSLK